MAIQSLSISSDGNLIAVGASSTGALLVYDLRKTASPLASLEGHKLTVNSVSF